MFDGATINLFVAITVVVFVTVGGRDLLVRQGLSRVVAQSVAGLVGIFVAVGFPLALG
ncbi:hypothetical protein [Neoroseomonas lacus]|uniref:Uncharacterized protein n=1 Tax=Neoroseomonas lacus TaxID=287609 RepID=A0A917NGF4_9PROT|nr:hypothetical protein [Neoroseomonas lacus]GGI99383.1 hypothetical protein GCM10011320_02700 [Neoroseomonas lacus]